MLNILYQYLDAKQANLIALMVISIPISYIFSRISSRIFLIILSGVCSFVFQYFVFSEQVYFLWVQQQIVYLLLMFCPRRKIGKIVFIQSFVFLLSIQIRRMKVAYGVNSIDITAILMMQVFLYIGLAYNYQNGAQPLQNLTQGAKKRRIIQFPSYLTYMGFTSFLPACLVGPVFQYKDYEDFVHRKGDYKNIPSTLKPAFEEMKIFLISLGFYALTMKFNLSYTITDQFDKQPHWYKHVYMIILIVNIGFRYILVWSLGMVSFHISGLSYDAQKKQFTKTQVSKVYTFFFNPSMKIKIQNWNISVQVALKRYIYEAYYNPAQNYQNQKQKRKLQLRAQTYTLMASAVWHGLYLGYFVTFFHWTLYIKLIQQIYRWRNKNPQAQIFYDKYRLRHLQSIVSAYVIVYFGIFFHLMTFERILIVLKTTYGIPFVFLYTSYILVVQFQILQQKKPNKAVQQSSDSSISPKKKQ